MIRGRYNRLIINLTIFSFLAGCIDTPNSTTEWTAAAEFEAQESTFICWNPTFQRTILNLTYTIAEHDHITLFYNERYHKPKNIEHILKNRGVNLNNITLSPFNLENDNVWIRDYGPVFMHNTDGQQDILTFKYDHEANQEYNLFGEQYSSKMRLSFMRSNIYSAGGGREINGKGTMLLIESYERSINPELSIQQIEQEYKEKLHQKNIIWLKRGIPQDDAFDNGPVLENIYGNGVNGHIDEFCRFADAQTILLAQVDPNDLMRDVYYRIVNERLEESYNILKNARDQDGNPFKIIRVPQAPILFNNGKYNGRDIYYTPVTSYLNFVITNNSVIVPSYYSEGDPKFIFEKDEAARRVFSEVFKHRKVVMSDALELNYSGGGLHCITLHKPKTRKPKNKLFGSS
ncbi:MAG: agmatine deiminase family protein [Cyclobacteriaceae bacterium]